mmetsp:Transcript_49388/g.138916  ORF Transcript_49388/g.138916 Transcript_49388/m.138916 type:complete len:202 (+) Transcript_49388:386-991(+)
MEQVLAAGHALHLLQAEDELLCGDAAAAVRVDEVEQIGGLRIVDAEQTELQRERLGLAQGHELLECQLASCILVEFQEVLVHANEHVMLDGLESSLGGHMRVGHDSPDVLDHDAQDHAHDAECDDHEHGEDHDEGERRVLHERSTNVTCPMVARADLPQREHREPDAADVDVRLRPSLAHPEIVRHDEDEENAEDIKAHEP